MLFEKVIDATVNVRNVINFCSDLDRHLMTELRDIYEGRCFKGAFVARVKRVLQSSACRVSSTSSSGEGHVDVQFLAEVAVFSRWDILVGIRVVSHQQLVVGDYEAPARLPGPRGPGPLGEDPGARARAGVGVPAEARGARAVVTFLPSKAVETLAVGQRVSARVVLAQHPPLQAQVAVIGTLLVCDKAAPVYRLQGELGPSARTELLPLLEAAELELGARAALARGRRADLWFFELLLCAYRPSGAAPDGGSQEIPAGAGLVWSGPAALLPAEEGVDLQNVLDLVRRAVRGPAVPIAGYWSRPLALYRSSPLAALAAEPPPGWQAAVDGTPRAVFVEFLKNILDFLVATREMAALYDTPELIEGHRNLWAAMRSEQLVFQT
jgi:hypothetical protein